jgi:LPXTG-motif cell wall-anchored protein
LAVTGADAASIAGLGALLTVGGAAVIVLTRKRKRFRAS